MSDNIHFSSATNEWETPNFLFDELDREFNFTLDPCATAKNAKCKHFYTKADDGLSRSWKNETVFMNPPYGREIKKWMEKAYMESSKQTTVVCLVPARTDTQWWHDYALQGEIRFLKGRLKFNGYKNSAPFPSAIVVLRAGKYAR